MELHIPLQSQTTVVYGIERGQTKKDFGGLSWNTSIIYFFYLKGLFHDFTLHNHCVIDGYPTLGALANKPNKGTDLAL